MPRAERLVLGVDIGGTKVSAGIVNPAGEIVASARRRMVADLGPADLELAERRAAPAGRGS